MLKIHATLKRITALGATLSAALIPLSVHAATITGGTVAFTNTAANATDFSSFTTTVLGWASGDLALGLALTSVLVGAGAAVAKNTPMPVLTGIALAAFIHWSPAIIAGLMGAALV